MEEFFDETVNQKTGMSIEIEWKYKQQCLDFILQMNKHFKGDTRQLCIAVQIFSLYTRKVPFTQF